MTKKEKKRFSPTARFALMATAFLLLVAAVLLILVRLGAFDRLILAEASRRLEAASGLKLAAEAIVVDPFRLSLRLRNPTLRSVAGRGLILQEFSADSVFLNVPRSVIFGGRLRFEKVRVVRPAAVLAPPRNPAEEPATPAPPDTDAAPAAGSAEPAGFGLRIDDLELEAGSVSWKGRTESFTVSLEGLDIRARYDLLRQSHLASLTASGGHLKYSDKDLDLERLDLEGRIGAREIVVETFEAATGASLISLTGNIRDYAAAPEFSGKARLSLSFLEIPLPTRLAAGTEGTLAAEVSFSGKPGGLAYEADVSTAGLRTRDLGSASIAGRVRGDLTSFSISGLDIRTEAGAVAGTFMADTSWNSFSAVELEWKDLDPDRILPLLPFGRDFPVSLGSLVSGRLEGQAGPLSLEGIKGSAFMSFVPKGPHGPSPSDRTSAAAAEDPQGLRKPPLRPAGEIALRASGGEFVLDTARLTAASASVEASGSLRRDGSLEGRYSVRVESIPETIEALRPFGVRVPLPAGPVFAPEGLTGSVFVAGAIRGRSGGPAFTAEIEIPQLGYGRLLAKSLKADLEGDLGKVTIRDLAAIVAGGAVRGSGTFILSPSRRADALALPSPSTRAMLPERFILELDDIQLAEFAALLPEPWMKSTEGLFNGRAEVTTGPEGFSAAFSVEGTSLATSSLRLPLLKFSGSYATSRLELNDLTVETENGALSGRGGFDLKNRTVSANLNTDGFGLEVFRPFLPADLGLGGRATLHLDTEGDLAAPRGTLNLSVTDLRAGSFTVPSVEFEARSDGATVEASLRLEDFNAGLEAKLALAPPYTILGKFVAEGLPLDRLIRVTAATAAAPSPAGNRLDIDAAFSYPLTDPAAFSAQVAFSGNDLRLAPPEEFLGPEPSSSPKVSVEGRILAAGDPSAPASLELDGEIPRLLVELGQTSLSNSETIR